MSHVAAGWQGEKWNVQRQTAHEPREMEADEKRNNTGATEEKVQSREVERKGEAIHKRAGKRGEKAKRETKKVGERKRRESLSSKNLNVLISEVK